MQTVIKENEKKGYVRLSMIRVACASSNIFEIPRGRIILLDGFNPLCANPTKWSNTLKQFVGFCWRIIWVFEHFVGLALEEVMRKSWKGNHIVCAVLEKLGYQVGPSLFVALHCNTLQISWTMFNPFYAIGLFFYPLKTPHKPEVFWCF